ncbi:preprotein translocase subunit SecA [Aciditerrimonas ferrireducens]|uniref:preprotein translocase subunit SecA n=1 Tax=Aciditerrimonas ferrireducens TaxID=667306 RepID=UPI0020044741|nr:preprotein translocase subunit SecA [Aciditerrimonas ferrireducens]MCK4177439.1 preprotein translocase subunit SecA [Aciditerrimonas ferrireducens]
MSIFARVLRAGEGKKVRRLAELVPLINELEPEMEALSDEELAHQTVVFRERLANGESLDDLLVEAFATVREAAVRVLGQRHYDVQLMGGMALHFGWIAEMKTGEGKTLVSTLPVYLNALTGRGVHVVTVNDYLAKRDAEWMGRVHRFLGLTVGRVTPEVSDPAAKRAAYACDVTYGTNTEFGFDYLRDNMARSREAMVQRGHVYAIVDEVDSILIDEARTPLIISGPAAESARLYYQFAGIARTLVRDEDYEVDEEKRVVVPTEAGIAKVERQLGVENLYDLVSVNYLHHLTQALRAKELYHRDKDYLVVNGEVKIVDEFTGRTLEGRRWSEGLHQAIEAKERVRIQEENHTWATITLQNYFRLYEKLAGMTGTAETEAAEFANTYGMSVVPIPTNLPMIRVDHPDVIYKTEDAKFAAIVEDIVERHERGQPVLVGTASVAKSEHLSRLLARRGIPHTVLNAKQHAKEAEIVAQAGRLGAVTVATNMAGRGVDILLGGNPEGLARQEVLAQGLDPESEEGQAEYERQLARFEKECAEEGDRVRELGGLYVLGSERHESRRIDNQLRGRAGRQGDPGESRFFLSLEDELMRLFATNAMQWVMNRALPEDVPIEAKMVSRAIERAQSTVEGRNAEIRKDVLKYDEVLDEQRKVIYARRLQVIDGEDLRERTERLLEETIRDIVQATCPGPYPETWDLGALVTEVEQYYPTKFTVEDLQEAESREQLEASVLAEALEYYRSRDEAFPGGAEEARQVEREVMLQIIDQRWRDHLAEMDYLREGINLRAMGQQDPLVAWQAEGFEMFGRMMAAIDDDYLRYVLHVQVVPQEAGEPDLSAARYEAAEDPVAGDGLLAALAALPQAAVAEVPGDEGVPVVEGAGGGAGRPVSAGGAAGHGAGERTGAGATRVGPASAGNRKLGRNDPCWCGSGKKYKVCHGAG